MPTSIRRPAIIATLCAALSGVSIGGQSKRAVEETQQATLGIAGFANSTPSLAVLDRTVAAVWTGTKDATVNVYSAISNDAGATFSEPRRVNDQDGDVSANNEQPPRVVISRSGATRVITVLWSKRNEGA